MDLIRLNFVIVVCVQNYGGPAPPSGDGMAGASAWGTGHAEWGEGGLVQDLTGKPRDAPLDAADARGAADALDAKHCRPDLRLRARTGDRVRDRARAETVDQSTSR